MTKMSNISIKKQIVYVHQVLMRVDRIEVRNFFSNPKRYAIGIVVWDDDDISRGMRMVDELALTPGIYHGTVRRKVWSDGAPNAIELVSVEPVKPVLLSHVVPVLDDLEFFRTQFEADASNRVLPARESSGISSGVCVMDSAIGVVVYVSPGRCNKVGSFSLAHGCLQS